MTSLAEEFIRTPSWHDDRGKVSFEKMLVLLEMMLKVPGCTPRRFPVQGHPELCYLVAIRGNGKRVIYVTGHVDTVPADNPAGVVPRIVGDKLFGLGSSDMKAQLVPPLLEFIEGDIDPSLTVVMVFLTDEELHSHSARQLVRDVDEGLLPFPDLALSPERPTPQQPMEPDKWAIVAGRRGHITEELILRSRIMQEGEEPAEQVDIHALYDQEVVPFLNTVFAERARRLLPHPLGLPEEFVERWSTFGEKPNYYTHRHGAEAIWSYYPAHLTATVGHSRAFFRGAIARLMEENVRLRRHVKVGIHPWGQHLPYLPYAVDLKRMRHRGTFQAVENAFDRSFGKAGYTPKVVGGRSTSDGNVLGGAGWPFLEMDAGGGNLHNSGMEEMEWISIPGISSVRLI